MILITHVVVGGGDDDDDDDDNFQRLIYWDFSDEDENDFYDSDGEEADIVQIMDNSLAITSAVLMFMKISTVISYSTLQCLHLFIQMLKTTMSPICHPMSTKNALNVI